MVIGSSKKVDIYEDLSAKTDHTNQDFEIIGYSKINFLEQINCFQCMEKVGFGYSIRSCFTITNY